MLFTHRLCMQPGWSCFSVLTQLLHVTSTPAVHLLPAAALLQIAISAKTVAVLGIKTENQAGQPAYYVPEYLQGVGCKIIPVPGVLLFLQSCALLSASPLHSRSVPPAGISNGHEVPPLLRPKLLCGSLHSSPPTPAAVYYPEVQQILGEPVVRDLKQARPSLCQGCRWSE